MGVTRNNHINKLSLRRTNIACFLSFVGPRFYTNTDDHTSTDDRKEKWSGPGAGNGKEE